MKISDWTIENSRARQCKRWSVYPDDVIDLTVAEMDFPTAEPVLEAIRDAVERQSFGYPIPDTSSDLPAIARGWLKTQNLHVPAEQIRITSDIIKGLVNAIRYLTAPHSPVAVITPTYSRFLDAVEGAERRAIQVPMVDSADGYWIDLDALETAFRHGAGSVILCNPSNPTGRLFTRDELTAVRDLATRYPVKVLSDEVHGPIRYSDEFTPYASLGAAAASHSITFTSASKAWNIPGLRCALTVFTNPEDNDRWNSSPRVGKGGISPLGMAATRAALTHGQEWLDDAREQLRINRDLIHDHLVSAGLDYIWHPPEATYLGWLDLQSFGFDDPRETLLTRARIATTGGDEHGAAGHGFVRLNFATQEPVLDQVMERLVATLQRAHPAISA